jgi:hypothetical protein
VPLHRCVLMILSSPSTHSAAAHILPLLPPTHLHAGILIWTHPDWKIADPICTLLFAVLVMLTTRGVILDVVHILLERAPRSVCMWGRVGDQDSLREPLHGQQQTCPVSFKIPCHPLHPGAGMLTWMAS